MSVELKGKKYSIYTESYQTWRNNALLRGLGFTLTRDEEGDFFLSGDVVELVFDNWIPATDGSKLTQFEQLTDPKSPHFNCMFVEVYRFKGPGGHDNVIIWEASSSQKYQLFAPIAVGGYEDWNEMTKTNRKADWERWIKRNHVDLA